MNKNLQSFIQGYLTVEVAHDDYLGKVYTFLYEGLEQQPYLPD